MENQVSSGANPPIVPLEPTRTGRPWPLWAGIGAAVALLVAVVGFFGFNAALDGQYNGKIEPGVSISGVYVGEMTRDQARQAVMKQLETFSQQPVVLSFQDKSWKPTLDQLGISINVDNSLNQAVAAGHTGDFFKDIRLFKLLSAPAYNLPLEVQLDEGRLNIYLTDISNVIRKDTTEPDVKLDADGKLVVTEGKVGFNVDYDGTYAAIKKNLQTLTASQDNLLQVHDVAPVITQQEIDELKNSLTPVLSGPVTINYDTKVWTFDPKQIAAQVVINRSTAKTDPHHLSFTFNTPYFEKYIEGLSKEINREPKDAEVGVDNGKVVFTKPSQEGRFLSVGRTMDNLNQALTATDPEKRKTTLWVDTKEPDLSSDHPEKLGNFDLMGEGLSSFSGSAYERSTNIKVGASYLTNTLVKPHSVFSFLDAVGEISARRGYVKGYAIVADQTVPDVGGGICQVSTTTFRAAFFAGLPIVERNAHAYRVSWYEEMGEPVGFDAAVYQPGADFKFENPTDYYMLVQAFASNGKLHVQIYGNKAPGQTVDLIPGDITNVTPPPPDRTEVDPTLSFGQKKQVDSAHKGLTTSITRVIKVNGQEVKRTVFPTRFAAWPNIFKVGPTPKPDPTPTTNSPTKNASPAPTSPAAPGTPVTPAPSQPTTPAQPQPQPTPKK